MAGYPTHPRRNSAAAQRFEERRLREDEAPRLRAEVPELSTLKLTIEDRTEGGATLSRHVRHVVVERAPALFFIGCQDPNCKDGGHDVTGSIMRALAGARTLFDGDDACRGTVGTVPCTRVLHYEAVAGYTR